MYDSVLVARPALNTSGDSFFEEIADTPKYPQKGATLSNLCCRFKKTPFLWEDAYNFTKGKLTAVTLVTAHVLKDAHTKRGRLWSPHKTSSSHRVLSLHQFITFDSHKPTNKDTWMHKESHKLGNPDFCTIQWWPYNGQLWVCFPKLSEVMQFIAEKRGNHDN